MKKRTSKQLVIDRLALDLRKPSARPLVDPDEAIAIALSMSQPGPARLVSPSSPMVRAILLSLKLAGHKIEPK
jgi:hypothetical protein